MLHQLLLASYSQPEAAGFILRGIKGIFVAIGSVIAAIVCALVAATKGRNPFGRGIFGLFFSILTLIVVIVIPSRSSCGYPHRERRRLFVGVVTCQRASRSRRPSHSHP